MDKLDEKNFSVLSELSKIDFTKSEEEKLSEELRGIIAFIGKVAEFDGEYDDRLDGGAVSFDDLREDVAVKSPEPDELLSNTVSENDCYIIPKVVD